MIHIPLFLFTCSDSLRKRFYYKVICLLMLSSSEMIVSVRWIPFKPWISSFKTFLK